MTIPAARAPAAPGPASARPGRAARPRSPRERRRPPASLRAARPPAREADGLTGEPMVRWAGEDDLVAQERLRTRRRDDAALRRPPRARVSRVGDAVDDRSACRATLKPQRAGRGGVPANSQSSRGSTTPPGPVDAPIVNVPVSAPSWSAGRDLVNELPPRTPNQPLRAAVEAKACLGGLEHGDPSGRKAAPRAASRAPAPAGSRPAGSRQDAPLPARSSSVPPLRKTLVTDASP